MDWVGPSLNGLVWAKHADHIRCAFCGSDWVDLDRVQIVVTWPILTKVGFRDDVQPIDPLINPTRLDKWILLTNIGWHTMPTWPIYTYHQYSRYVSIQGPAIVCPILIFESMIGGAQGIPGQSRWHHGHGHFAQNLCLDIAHRLEIQVLARHICKIPGSYLSTGKVA